MGPPAVAAKQPGGLRLGRRPRPGDLRGRTSGGGGQLAAWMPSWQPLQQDSGPTRSAARRRCSFATWGWPAAGLPGTWSRWAARRCSSAAVSRSGSIARGTKTPTSPGYLAERRRRIAELPHSPVAARRTGPGRAGLLFLQADLHGPLAGGDHHALDQPLRPTWPPCGGRWSSSSWARTAARSTTSPSRSGRIGWSTCTAWGCCLALGFACYAILDGADRRIIMLSDAKRRLRGHGSLRPVHQACRRALRPAPALLSCCCRC